MSTRTLKATESEQREAAPLKHLNLPDDLFDRGDPEQAMIDAGDRSDTLGIDRGMTIPAAFFEPLPDDLLAAFEGDGEAT